MQTVPGGALLVAQQPDTQVSVMHVVVCEAQSDALVQAIPPSQVGGMPPVPPLPLVEELLVVLDALLVDETPLLAVVLDAAPPVPPVPPLPVEELLAVLDAVLLDETPVLVVVLEAAPPVPPVPLLPPVEELPVVLDALLVDEAPLLAVELDAAPPVPTVLPWLALEVPDAPPCPLLVTLDPPVPSPPLPPLQPRMSARGAVMSAREGDGHRRPQPVRLDDPPTALVRLVRIPCPLHGRPPVFTRLSGSAGPGYPRAERWASGTS